MYNYNAVMRRLKLRFVRRIPALRVTLKRRTEFYKEVKGIEADFSA